MDAIRRTSGAVAAAAPLLLLPVSALHEDWLARLGSFELGRAWPILVLLPAVLAVFAGALAAHAAPTRARALLVAGSVGWVVHAVEPLASRPTLGLVTASALALLAHLLWPVRAPELTPRPWSPQAAQACLVALLAWPISLVLGVSADVGSSAALASSIVIASGLAGWAVVVDRALLPRVVFAGSVIASGVMIALSWGEPGAAVAALTLIPATHLAVSRVSLVRGAPTRVLDALFLHPARALVVTFAGLCVAGTMLLRLPVMAAPGKSISAVDAAFSATSAVCVTGLMVLDTPVDFSVAGHVALLVLIQVGGLGIMAFSTAAIAALGQRLSMRHEAVVADMFSGNRAEIGHAVRRLLGVTFAAELLGAGALTWLFMQSGDRLGQAVWRGVFTAISAFCNAGIALQSDNLMPYRHDPGIPVVVSLLIIVGGLSPAAVLAIPALLRGRRVSTQSRLVLVTTAALLAAGTVLFAALEWSSTLAPLTLGDRLHAAWFQSASLRTAGFNTVDFSALRPATVWVMLVFMLIGGSPGGTAGGIKTTTAAVLMLAVGSAMRGRWEASLYGRRLAHRTVYKAAAIATVALSFVFVGVAAVQVTQDLELTSALFEVVSALATVGLSLGATARLDDVGRVIIMVCMFIGRVGPLTLFLFLRDRATGVPWKVPIADIDVG